jgi:hypothetical protein
MKISKYVINPSAPLKNVWLLLTLRPYRVPFVVNTSKCTAIPQPDIFYIVEQMVLGVNGLHTIIILLMLWKAMLVLLTRHKGR